MSLTLQKRDPKIIDRLLSIIAQKSLKLGYFALELYMFSQNNGNIKPEDLTALKEKKKELDTIMEKMLI